MFPTLDERLDELENECNERERIDAAQVEFADGLFMKELRFEHSITLYTKTSTRLVNKYPVGPHLFGDSVEQAYRFQTKIILGEGRFVVSPMYRICGGRIVAADDIHPIRWGARNPTGLQNAFSDFLEAAHFALRGDA